MKTCKALHASNTDTHANANAAKVQRIARSQLDLVFKSDRLFSGVGFTESDKRFTVQAL